MGDFVTVKTDSGYDVVDASTGLVIGELERFHGVYVTPQWVGLTVINSGNGGWEGLTLYHPVFQSRHGECTIKRMAERLWQEARGYLRALAKRNEDG